MVDYGGVCGDDAVFLQFTDALRYGGDGKSDRFADLGGFNARIFLQEGKYLNVNNVKLVQPSSSSEVFEQILEIGKDDVLFAISFPRYSTKIVNAVKYARAENATVISLTDSSVSPIAEHASCLLTAQSDMASFVDSLVAPLSILNAIIVAVTKQCEAEVTKRFDRLESIWDEYEVYAKK